MPRAVPALLLGALLGVVPALPGPAVAETVDQSYAMPSTAWITITGHGYGHGHGMSQYGAEGAARGRGSRSAQIARFYYAGTSWGDATGRVRVQISADTTNDLVVRTRSGLTLRDAGTGQNTVLPDNGPRPAGGSRSTGRAGTRCRLLPPTAGVATASLSGEGAFAAGRRAGHPRHPLGQPAPTGAWLRPGGGSTAGNTINIVTLEAYLRGVVPKEMPATSWESGGGPGPGGRGAHLRGVRAGPPGDAAPPVRHHLLPGVRRLRRRAPGLQRRHRPRPAGWP